MLLIMYWTIIMKWCGFLIGQFVLPYKQMDADTQLFVFDKFSPALTLWRGAILALPMKMLFVDEIIMITVLGSFSLLIERNQQYMRFLILKNNMTTIPITWVEDFPKKLGYFFPHKLFPYSQFQRIDDSSQSCQCPHAFVSLIIWIIRICGF